MNASDRMADRIADHAYQSRLDMVPRLIAEWAEVQQEALIREIWKRPVPFLRSAA